MVHSPFIRPYFLGGGGTGGAPLGSHDITRKGDNLIYDPELKAIH